MGRQNGGKGEFFFDAERNGTSVTIYKYAAKESIIKEVEASLRRLGTDYIDLLQIHWPDSCKSEVPNVLYSIMFNCF